MKRLYILVALALTVAACQKQEQNSSSGGSTVPSSFNEPSGWTVVGTIDGTGWAKDFEMRSDGTWHAVFGMSVSSDDKFKFRRGRSWDTNLGAGPAGSTTTVTAGEKVYLTTSGGDIKIAGGTYDMYIAPDNQIAYFLPAGTAFTHQAEGEVEIGGDLYGDYNPGLAPSEKKSGITYQLNVYSFADSDGDGWGDFQGIIDHLDYLDALGATALWLSPVNASQSYHAYDIKDYFAINPIYGGESKLQELIDKAKEKNIDIYLDYVLNHSGDQCEWFKKAKAGDAKYKNYYVMADARSADVDNFAGMGHPGMGGWHQFQTFTGRLKFTVTWDGKTTFTDKDIYDHMTVLAEETTEAAQSSNPNAKIWIYTGAGGKTDNFGLYDKGNNTYEIVLDVNSNWGFLVRTSTSSWSDGQKWGGDGRQFRLGQVYKPTPKGASDLCLGLSFFGSFDITMPDLSYGPWQTCQNSDAFKDLAASADKWINMGVNGLRLDAVMWIYQLNENANVKFLSEWYNHCNTTYKARGGQGDIYMVGEAYDHYANKVAPYYKGLPSLFDFPFYVTVKDRLNRGYGSDLGSEIKGIQDKNKAAYANASHSHRSGFQDAIKLSNHDEDRVASDLGNKDQLKRLAGAILLTSPGKPYVYQGEELGYWGTKKSGDQNVRQPVYWEKGKALPEKWSSFAKDILKDGMSVEEQSADDRSLLQLYCHFAYARNTHSALAEGEIETTASGNDALAAWYLKSSKERVLVMHNLGAAPVTVTRDSDKLDKIIVSNKKIEVSGKSVTLPPYSSVVFQQ